jgi:hypothetical protein
MEALFLLEILKTVIIGGALLAIAGGIISS